MSSNHRVDQPTPSLPLSLDFDSSDDDSLVSAQIYLLTWLMSHRRCGSSDSKLPPKDKHLGIWSALSSVLSMGGYSQQTREPNPVVAVTGHIGGNGIEAFIFARNSATWDGPDPYEITEITQGTIVDALKLAQSLPASDVKFNVHARDVLTILAHSKTIISTSQDLIGVRITKSMFTSIFVSFMMRRTYRNIAKRIEAGSTIWGKHPIRLIHLWYENPQSGPSRIRDVRACGVEVLHYEHLLTALAEANILPVNLSEPLKFEVNSENVLRWTTILLGCLNVLENTFPDKQLSVEPNSVEPTSVEPTSVRHVDDEACGEAENAFASLESLLRGGVLKALFTPSLEDDMEHAVKKQKATGSGATNVGAAATTASVNAEDGAGKAAMQPATASEGLARAQSFAATGGDAHHDSEDKSADGPAQGGGYDAEEDAEDMAEAAPGERTSGHVKRYISAMLIPYTAPRKVVHFVCQAADRPAIEIKASLVTVTSSVKVDPSVIQSVQHKLNTMFTSGDMKEATERLLKKARAHSKFYPTVHAEAALMALTYAPPKGTAVGRIPGSMTATPIGISKRCCFCCALLGKLLNEQRNTSTHPTFVLPGTHGVLYPWAPPAIGIPSDVLKGIRSALVQELYKNLEEDSGSHSVQTSPAWSDHIPMYRSKQSLSEAQKAIKAFMKGVEEGAKQE